MLTPKRRARHDDVLRCVPLLLGVCERMEQKGARARHTCRLGKVAKGGKTEDKRKKTARTKEKETEQACEKPAAESHARPLSRSRPLPSARCSGRVTHLATVLFRAGRMRSLDAGFFFYLRDPDVSLVRPGFSSFRFRRSGGKQAAARSARSGYVGVRGITQKLLGLGRASFPRFRDDAMGRSSYRSRTTLF